MKAKTKTITRYYMYEQNFNTLYGVKNSKAECIRALNEDFPTPSNVLTKTMPFEIQIIKKEIEVKL